MTMTAPTRSLDHAYDFQFSRDVLGRLRIDRARLAVGWSDPLGDLPSLYRPDILFRPTSPAERDFLSAARHLPEAERRVVVHYILAHRVERYKRDLVYEAERATALRRQDAVDSDNQRQSHYLAYLGRQAERHAADVRARTDQHAAAERLRTTVTQRVLLPATATTALARVEGPDLEPSPEEDEQLER